MTDISLTSAPVTWQLANQVNGPRATGANGYVEFEASAVAAFQGGLTWMPSPQRAEVVDGEMAPLDLPINDPDVWNWRVTPHVGVIWAPFHVNVPDGGVDLSSAAITPGTGPVRVLQGPQGGSVVGAEDQGDGTIRFILDDGTRTDPMPITRGPAGPANELAIGTVVRGKEAHASLTGVPPEQVLNLVLPKGDQGDLGPRGEGVPDGAPDGMVVAGDGTGTAWVPPVALIPAAAETAPGLVSLTDVSDRAETVTREAMTDVVHTDELFHSVVLTSDMASTIVTLFVAPFSLRITSVQMVFDTLTLPASSTEYLTVVLRKYLDGGTVMVSRSSADGAISPRVPWLFDAAAWNSEATYLDAGDMLNLGFSTVGSATSLAEFPASITFGYEPT